MKLTAILFFLLSVISLKAQSTFPSYYLQNELNLTSPGAMKYGLYGYDNPAILSTLQKPDILFLWSDKTGEWSDFNNWGLFAAFPNIGFGLIKQKVGNLSVTDYKLSGALGSNAYSIGLSYGWSGGDNAYFNHSDLFTIGSLFRPSRYLSFGIVGNIPTSGNSEGALDLALRPLGDEKLTLFGDFIFKNQRNPDDIRWSAGAAFEFLPGIRLTGRYFNTKFFSTGIQVSFGNIGLSTQTSFNKDGNHLYNVYGIRVGAYDRTFFEKLKSDNNYVEMNLYGRTNYQRFKWFDNSKTLYELLNQIEAAKNDKSVSGIAINTSGMEMNREMIWEVRKKLDEFKSAGKKIVVYIDRATINQYHLASAADQIILDPQGFIVLEGYMWGRNYFKGALDKLGIGFTELRYFKYKSAAETYSRESMSEADKEQLQMIVDDWYQLAKEDICKGRNISYKKFDDLVDHGLFLPEDALRENLADTIGRWDSVGEIIKKIESESKNLISPVSLAEFNQPDDNYWGEKPKVAIIYALGICAMNEGIKARELVKDVEAVAGDNNVKAVVLRVDSPGGDGLASDIVAEAIRKCKEKKPVIVSQGSVAASGGYWLSMYGDTIIAAPGTITASIGVIGGWLYNKDFKEKIGISIDYVKQGEHADLGFGMRIPFIGLQIPDRDLNEREKEAAESAIKKYYKEFVSKAALARDTSYEYIDSIGEGRVWSGIDGLKLGLIDELGSLYDAIDIALKRANLKDQEYEIVMLPEMPLFDISSFIPRPFGIEIETDPVIEHLKLRIKNNGYPMPVLPIENFELFQVE
jgi:protease-4